MRAYLNSHVAILLVTLGSCSQLLRKVAKDLYTTKILTQKVRTLLARA